MTMLRQLLYFLCRIKRPTIYIQMKYNSMGKCIIVAANNQATFPIPNSRTPFPGGADFARKQLMVKKRGVNLTVISCFFHSLITFIAVAFMDLARVKCI